jgi:hypothetical protein
VAALLALALRGVGSFKLSPLGWSRERPSGGDGQGGNGGEGESGDGRQPRAIQQVRSGTRLPLSSEPRE